MTPAERVKRIEDEAVGRDLSSWERFDFLPSIKQRSQLSDKQESVLRRIERRLFKAQSATCESETCSICGKPATHKVGEEIPSDDPAWKTTIGHLVLTRHNYTAYVCCKHFKMIFGSAVACPTPNG